MVVPDRVERGLVGRRRLGARHEHLADDLGEREPGQRRVSSRGRRRCGRRRRRGGRGGRSRRGRRRRRPLRRRTRSPFRATDQHQRGRQTQRETARNRWTAHRRQAIWRRCNTVGAWPPHELVCKERLENGRLRRYWRWARKECDDLFDHVVACHQPDDRARGDPGW
ncbi:hypothetical protein FE697_021465 [Mumia zhuanghuii]|uniref:Uncharacterized protein n=1 Tax=Mumia zhuanghuii TaxID=2585211 RepID=A0A5Q6RK49_9ACTN|nr:hypothetical protein FE697_021465 [Mumia zhuanghuii]